VSTRAQSATAPATATAAKGAVVAEDVEAVRRPLEGAAGLVAPVRARPDVGGQHGAPLVRRQPASELEELVVGERRGGVERGGHHLQLTVGIEVRQGDLAARLRAHPGQEPPGRRARRHPRLGQVGRPGHAARRDVDAPEEGGDDRAEFAQHLVRVPPDLGERVRAHPEQELLPRLATPVDADV
jgi:hypothetical protein